MTHFSLRFYDKKIPRRFGSWTRLGRAFRLRSDWRTARGHHARIALAVCRCDCGCVSVVQVKHLCSGASLGCVSCGRDKSRRHGMHGTAEYRVWAQMIQRCVNPNNVGFKDYGGRGITVCERWRKSFADFFADVGKRPGKGFQLDRRENNKGYEPGNVRWATRTVNLRNRRNTRVVILDSVPMSLREAAEVLGIPHYTISSLPSGKLHTIYLPEA